MERFKTHYTREDLPDALPLFPLQGAMLLPCGRLPLNIFEPHCLELVMDALEGNKLIGMIQPRTRKGECYQNEGPLYETGCAGRITSYTETKDGRLLITLTGVCRFKYVEDLANTAETGYRRGTVDWAAYVADLDCGCRGLKDREALLSPLKEYLKSNNMCADWETVCCAADTELVNNLSMICPFSPCEKQALLEAPCIEARAKILTTLMEMSTIDGGQSCKET